ncbi:hypothetical protein QY702_00005, partial [Xanthomonas campestris pv. plantaginis]|uniref:hypothetical protein n=1 Tax=Xanthomonas campestris TaxID=339 RepID=UPI002B2226EA
LLLAAMTLTFLIVVASLPANAAKEPESGKGSPPAGWLWMDRTALALARLLFDVSALHLQFWNVPRRVETAELRPSALTTAKQVVFELQRLLINHSRADQEHEIRIR